MNAGYLGVHLVKGDAVLNRREKLEYVEASDHDRAWFSARPGRRFRFRMACAAERKVFAGLGVGAAAHVLVHQIKPYHRERQAVLWGIAGPLPDDATLLARLAAGAVFHGGEGSA